MGNEASDKMMALLHELSRLNELNNQYEAKPQESEEDAHRARLRRCLEITEEIHGFMAKKKPAEI